MTRMGILPSILDRYYYAGRNQLEEHKDENAIQRGSNQHAPEHHLGH